MDNTKRVGNLTELQCITRLYEIGCSISIPYGNSDKYDIIIDRNGTLYKVQVKHANPHFDDMNEIDTITIKTTWEGHNYNGYSRNKYNDYEIDFFATYFNNECYLIPITEYSGTMKTLRVKVCKNNQTKGVSFLKNYVANDVLNH